MEHTNEERYEYLAEVLGVNTEMIDFAICVYGANKESYNSVLWYTTAERDIDDAIDEYNAEMEG